MRETAHRRGAFLAAGCVSLWLAAGSLSAQSNDDCLLCHEVPAGLDASRHAGLECVLCHQDLMEAELPHEELPGPVDCSPCHDAQAGDHGASLHGQAAARGDPLAPSCVDCHGGHDVRPHTDPASTTAPLNIPVLCGQCHREGAPVARAREIPQDRILQNYSMSIHGFGLYAQGLTVTAVCTSCHTSHRILPHTDPRSSIHKDNVAATCAACHGQIEQVHRAVIEGRLWQEEPHKIPACVDCHSPHKIRRVFYPAGLANQDCLDCHADPQLSRTTAGGTPVSLFVDAEAYAASEHADTACAQCHVEASPARERPCETVVSRVDCSICHAQQVAEFSVSTHGMLAAAGDADAPTCLSCHERHATQDHELPGSPTFARNVPELCAGCHRVGERAALRIDSGSTPIVEGYIDSIHGKGLVESGLVVTATCPDCHSAHMELPPDDPRSTVHEDNVAATCGGCHHGIQEQYEASIHWHGRPDEGRDLPSCASCHSSHTISRTDRDDFRLTMMDQCGRCHVQEAVTFFDTFHGKVSKLGSAGAAKCYDCHGTHNILPTTDAASTLSRDNVVETCAQCHEGSHRRFAGYLTHATHHDVDKYPWLFWSFWLMTVLLIGTLSFALLHTFAWLVRLWLTRDQWKRHKLLAHADGQKLYRRFDRNQRTMHMMMLLSFFTLALTGMALKFSYMGWAQLLSRLLGGFRAMGILHRIGAVVLLIVALMHVYDVWRKKHERNTSWSEVLRGPGTILFTWRDFKEVVQSIKWFFGLGPRPHYGRYTYWEKFDYFAVVWGILVIGSTGLVLWFPELFTRLLPGWSVNVATIVHSDEALLAVGFIFTIHFFNTHFRPDKFPMDPVIFTGRVTVDELRYDKPAEYEEHVRRGTLEQHLVEPFPRPVERLARVFGFSALAVGLGLIVLIVYAMLFGYR